MSRIRVIAALIVAGLLLVRLCASDRSAEADEALDRTLCQLIEKSAEANGLPVPFLTRLIFRESTFRVDAVSRSGAQGVAQFLPTTAAALGLADPFDPEQAIPLAARHLSDLHKRFGNLGLAAAAYNGGPTRIATWLAGRGDLKAEARGYVAFVTGRDLEDWRGGRYEPASSGPVDGIGFEDAVDRKAPGCLMQLAALRTTVPGPRIALAARRPIPAASVVHVANPMARVSPAPRVATARSRPAATRLAVVRDTERLARRARPAIRIALERTATMPWQDLAHRTYGATEQRRAASRPRETTRPRYAHSARQRIRVRAVASRMSRRGIRRRASRV